MILDWDLNLDVIFILKLLIIISIRVLNIFISIAEPLNVSMEVRIASFDGISEVNMVNNKSDRWVL